ncbi:MAG: Mov34/MPN/PAD-1 family protein, partial [Nitrososphaera sp.]
GKSSRDESVVLEVMPMANAESSPVSFSINPDELLKAYDLAEERGHDVIGIFHSHPGRPTPSGTDIRFMELNPVVWVIYSTTENEFKAFVSDVQVREVAIKTKD